jgi:hypothetical protein
MRHHRCPTLFVAAGVLAAVLALAGAAEAAITQWKFGLVGVVFDAGQAVQVNASHFTDPEIAPSPCSVLVEFFDGVTGGSLKTTRLTVPSGRTQSADLVVSESVPLRGKVPIYARVTIGDPNAHPACTRPSLEVFDKASGRTVVTFEDPNLQPDPEAFFPALTLVTGQFLRLNAVNYGDPNEAPCPIRLTIFAADGGCSASNRHSSPQARGPSSTWALRIPTSASWSERPRAASSRAVTSGASAGRSSSRRKSTTRRRGSRRS